MLGYAGYIASFEPDPVTYQLLLQAADGDEKWLTYNAALGASLGKMSLNVIETEDGETTLSSFREHIGGLPTKVVSVDVHTVDDVIKDIRLPSTQCIFLKMDTQGFDLEVFAGARKATSIRLMQSEVSVVPLYREMPSYLDALATYQAAGFNLLDLFIVNRTPDGGVLEYDTLMVR